MDSIYSELKEKFANKKLFLKRADEKIEVAIVEFRDDDTLIIGLDPELVLPPSITIYGLSDKYIEVHLEIIDSEGEGYYHCKLIDAKRAAQGRNGLRFKVEMGQVSATNFKISKATIDVDGPTIPTGIKIILDQFQFQNVGMADIVKVGVLRSDVADPLLKAIKKTGQSVLVEDFLNPESFNAENENIFDLKRAFGKELPIWIRQNTMREFKSMVIVPIIFINDKMESNVFAYIQLISKSTYLSIDDVFEIKGMTFELIDRIRDANSLSISINQEIMDLSRGGAKLKVTDENLKKAIVKTKGFVFDIVFRLQAPITMFGDICSVSNDDEGNVIVGISFGGSSSRKDEVKRYYSVLEPMEAEYKANLVKSLKQQGAGQAPK